jgi:hypothetical protein
MTRTLNTIGLVIFTVLILVATYVFFTREELPALYINEFMAYNTACCPDTTMGREESDDWIEIYNGGEKPIDIGGMYFSQNKKKPLGHQIPVTHPELTTIPPGGHLLIWADGSPEQGVLHLNFKLAQAGEFIVLFYKDGRMIDGLKFGKQNENTSYGRSPDGSDTWKEFTIPTPGKSN